MTAHLPTLSRRFVLLAGAAGLAGCSSYIPEGNTRAGDLSVATITSKINETRAAHGKKPVTYSSVLARAAKNHTNLMASKGELSHSLGGSLRERVRAVGYIGAVGENIAGGQSTLEKAIKGWLDSPGHRGTLLNDKFSEFGLAYTAGRAPYKNYWVLIMGGDTNLWVERR